MKISDVCNILNVQMPIEDKEVTGIAYAKANIKEDSLFFAIRTKALNTYANIEIAKERRAAVIVTEKYISDYPCIVVKDSFDALMKVGEWYRQKLNTKIVAVTGSVGKTSTKDMIFSAISKAGVMEKSNENSNSITEFVINLFELQENAAVLVQELTIHNVKYASSAMRPDIAVVTNIGYSHIEEFGSVEGICAEKLKIAKGLSEKGKLILNYDDKLLKEYGQKSSYDIISYGIESDASYRAIEIEQLEKGYRFMILHNDEKYPAEISCFGRHNISNALASFAVGQSLGISSDILLLGIKEYVPEGIRQNVFEKNGVTVIADCYNAAPDSMKSSLSMLDSMNVIGKKVAVLGDMFEMGQYSHMLHNYVGEYINGTNINEVILFGDYARYIAEKIDDGKKVTFVQKRDSLINMLKPLSEEKGNAILFKASRGMMLETVIDEIFNTNYYDNRYERCIWALLDKQGYNVDKYFEDKGIRNVAVYGLSLNGINLMAFMERHKVVVDYAIDRMAKYLPENAYDFEVYDLTSDLKYTDAIIISLPMPIYETVRNEVEKIYAGNIIWYKDMVDEIVNKY